MKTFRVTKEVKMTKGLYRVITRSTESFTTEAESEEDAKRMFVEGEFFGEYDVVEDYEVLSTTFIRKLRGDEV